jgi:hypothetical protein
VLASVTLAAGVLLVVAALVTLRATVRLRHRVRAASWLLTRVAVALAEARRAGRV